MIEFPVNGYGVWCVVLMRCEEFKEEWKEGKNDGWKEGRKKGRNEEKDRQ